MAAVAGLNSIPDVCAQFVLVLIGMIVLFVSLKNDDEDEESQVMPMGGMKERNGFLVEDAPVLIDLFGLIVTVAESG